MLFVIPAFFGGVLTILSPCILPVLPFVFMRTNEPFRRNGLPLLCGMAVTFAAVATLAAVGGGWVVRANEWGRWLALALVTLFGLALLLPGLAARLTRPLVSLGNTLGNGARNDGGLRSSLVLGVATGLLWAPCAGPILGLILTGAALRGANVQTSLLLLAYATGSGVSLAAALLLGGRAFAALKGTLRVEQWVRRALGGAVVAGALAIAFGLDTGLLARVSTASTTKLEEVLLRLLPSRGQDDADVLLAESSSAGGAMMAGNNPAMLSRSSGASAQAPQMLPSLDGATQWLNSGPLAIDALRGKVVLIDFWTYSCINCIRALPYVRAWNEKYRGQGLVVIGIHSPEFAFEKNVRNVEREVRDLRITYPVAIDNDYALWRAFSNEYWPAHYFIDAQGAVRHTHFGEGGYDASERVLQQLLAEAGQVQKASAELVAPVGDGAALPSDELSVLSPETYIGYRRAEGFVSPGGQVPDAAHDYTVPARLGLNDWALAGTWTVGDEDAALRSAPGRIVLRFQARDLHLVLGARDGEKPIRFRVRIDGAPPGEDHGLDVDAAGEGAVTEHRLYQLIRQSGEIRARLFEIEFLEPNVLAYAFTFG